MQIKNVGGVIGIISNVSKTLLGSSNLPTPAIFFVCAGSINQLSRKRVKLKC